MRDDYSSLDWSKAIKNPFAGKLKKDGKYTVTINKPNGNKERYHIDAETLERTRINEKVEFDYTAQRSNLQDEDISLRRLSHKAMEEYKT